MSTMDLDLNKFRTLIPINALYDDTLLHLARETRLERLHRGDTLFEAGDEDGDSVFLLSGAVSETGSDGAATEILAGSNGALYALGNLKPRQFRAEVTSESATIARIETSLLEKMLAWDQFSPEQPPGQGDQLSEGPDAEESEWMMSMLQTSVFLRLPPANIHALFSYMQEITVEAGELIIEQGKTGDYYYIIKQGRCKVFRRVGSGEHLLAELNACQAFGEEALISDSVRNASVKMLTPGKLMRLSKQDFVQLMKEPLLDWADAQTASELLASGAVRVDVRLDSEFRKSSLSGAINIPLHRLRSTAETLDKSKRYILFCDTGQRSSAAAFLLQQLGFDVFILKGGISHSS